MSGIDPHDKKLYMSDDKDFVEVFFMVKTSEMMEVHNRYVQKSDDKFQDMLDQIATIFLKHGGYNRDSLVKDGLYSGDKQKVCSAIRIFDAAYKHAIEVAKLIK